MPEIPPAWLSKIALALIFMDVIGSFLGPTVLAIGFTRFMSGLEPNGEE